MIRMVDLINFCFLRQYFYFDVLRSQFENFQFFLSILTFIEFQENRFFCDLRLCSVIIGLQTLDIIFFLVGKDIKSSSIHLSQLFF